MSIIWLILKQIPDVGFHSKYFSMILWGFFEKYYCVIIILKVINSLIAWISRSKFKFYWLLMRTSLVAQMVGNESSFSVRSLGQEDPLVKGMLPTPVFLLGEFHGQRSLTGSSSWGPKSQTLLSDKHFHFFIHKYISVVFLNQDSNKVHGSHVVHVP